MVIRFDNMWISLPALLIPILFVIILMTIIRVWSFSAPKWTRPVPSYSLHVMKDLPGHSTVDAYPLAPIRPTSAGFPSRYATTTKGLSANTFSTDSSVFGASAPPSDDLDYKPPPNKMYYYEPGSRGVPQSVRRPEGQGYGTASERDSDATSGSTIKKPLSTDFL